MARPRKGRNVCHLPENNRFGPLGVGAGKKSENILMTVEQYETIRLIDLEGLTQEECAKQMDIARTSVQRIYSQARKNLSKMLVNGDLIKIEGGNYVLCKDSSGKCESKPCCRNKSK